MRVCVSVRDKRSLSVEFAFWRQEGQLVVQSKWEHAGKLAARRAVLQHGAAWRCPTNRNVEHGMAGSGAGGACQAGKSRAAILALVSPHEVLQAGRRQGGAFVCLALPGEVRFAARCTGCSRPALQLSSQSTRPALCPRSGTCTLLPGAPTRLHARCKPLQAPRAPRCCQARPPHPPTHLVELGELFCHVRHVCLWREDGGAHVEGAGLLRFKGRAGSRGAVWGRAVARRVSQPFIWMAASDPSAAGWAQAPDRRPGGVQHSTGGVQQSLPLPPRSTASGRGVHGCTPPEGPSRGSGAGSTRGGRPPGQTRSRAPSRCRSGPAAPCSTGSRPACPAWRPP